MRFLALLLFCFFTIQSQAQTANQLKAWFCFDSDTLNDCSGNGSVGQPVNDPSLVCGVQNSAARLDGIDDAIVFIGPINDALSAGDFTISFFMKPSPPANSGTQLIMRKQGDMCDDRPSFSIRYGFTSNTILASIAESDTVSLTVQGTLDADPCWQHITVSRQEDELRLYINGVRKDTKVGTKRIDLTSNDILKISEPVCPLDQPYAGDIDELRVYTKALTDNEVVELDVYMPDQIANRDTLIYLGNSFQINTTNSCAQSYEWLNTDGVSDITIPNPTITPIETSTYELAFKHSGCIAYDRINVTVIDPDSLDCTKVFLPNAFTPGNTLGLNDEFVISNPFAIVDFLSFEIYDRWGGRVFKAASQFEGWDGTFNDDPVNAGMYLYRLRYECQGEEIIRNGSVVLLR